MRKQTFTSPSPYPSSTHSLPCGSFNTQHLFLFFFLCFFFLVPLCKFAKKKFSHFLPISIFLRNFHAHILIFLFLAFSLEFDHCISNFDKGLIIIISSSLNREGCQWAFFIYVCYIGQIIPGLYYYYSYLFIYFESSPPLFTDLSFLLCNILIV